MGPEFESWCRHHSLLPASIFGPENVGSKFYAHHIVHWADGGEIIPTGPCRNSRGNAQSLFEAHLDSGIVITPKTAQSQWMGEQMDDDLAILGMLQLE